MCLGLIESALRLSNYGYPTRFLVQVPGGDAYMPNRKFTRQFYARETATEPWPFVMPAKKAAGTLRIFVLGESAAAGTPDPAFGFARILQVMLRVQYPDRNFEVVNAAMRGINSHIVRRIARECAQFQPDCFLVYMGNNEAVGLYSPEPSGFNLASSRLLLKTVEWAKATRLGQLADTVVRRARPHARPGTQDMDFFRNRRMSADDPRRALVYDHFRSNLAEISTAALQAGAKLVLCTVAVNLRDFPPLASLHRAQLSDLEKTRWEEAFSQGIALESSGSAGPALGAFGIAEKIDDHYADLHFRMGRCHFSTQDLQGARRHFGLARDWDAMQFRTDRQVNEILRQHHPTRMGGTIEHVDVERAFETTDRSPGQIPGAELFTDHVHFTFDGDYLVARTVVTGVGAALGLPAPTRQMPSRDECAKALAFTPWDEVNVAAAMVRMTAQPPFLDQIDHEHRQRIAEQSVSNRVSRFTAGDLQRATQTYQEAIRQAPYDWQLHYNLGNLLSEGGDPKAAAEEFELALKSVPSFVPLRLALAHAWLEAGNAGLARGQVGEALRIDPESRAARAAWEQLGGR